MADTIKVRAHPDVPEGEVVLWERDEEHPDGEVFISADGREHEVGETPAVNGALATRRLVRVESAPRGRRPAAVETAPPTTALESAPPAADAPAATHK